jgi:hypothetical protein
MGFPVTFGHRHNLSRLRDKHDWSAKQVGDATNDR